MKEIAFLIISFLVSSLLQAQPAVNDSIQYKATYLLEYQPDSTDAGSVTTEEMLLYIGDRISIFASKGRAAEDSLDAKATFNGIAGTNFGERARLTETDFNYTIYKGFPEGKISHSIRILKDRLRYQEDLDLQQWEISPETKAVNGFHSQKATTSFAGREYIAWFTTEIPISDGPYKFHGLPGLIVELKDLNNHYHFKLTGFRVLSKPVPVAFNEGDFVNTGKEKLLELQRAYEEDPFAVMESHNTGPVRVSVKFEKGAKKKLLKKMRKELAKKNNPIELN